ncbi:hypothetical protein M885DRAFT_561895 [Pelagophyceae sp. CCMP2097]|nr:hypothetical protein M885DRAFT_561895 [Pelagophyceae sp. CCMP2097]
MFLAWFMALPTLPPAQVFPKLSRVQDAELLQWAAEGALASEGVVYVLPGNPGLAAYYTDFAAHLHSKTRRTVLALGWLGFSEDGAAAQPRGRVDLEAQIDFARASLPRDVPITLVGHSIGALVALDLLSAPPPGVDIVAVVAVFPFVAANPANPTFLAKFQGCLTLAKYAPVLRALAWVLQRIPEKPRAWLLSKVGQETAHMSAASRALTLDAMTRPSNVAAMINMGASEFESDRITKGPDLTWLHRKADVTVVFSTAPDCWVKNGAREALDELGVHTVLLDAAHDFCTCSKASIRVADAVADVLR